MDKFNTFNELAFDIKQKLLSFCDYAPKTLSRYDSIVELFKDEMAGSEIVFSFTRIKKWLDCFIAFNNYGDYTYKKYRRILLLLNDNYIGQLNLWMGYWQIYAKDLTRFIPLYCQSGNIFFRFQMRERIRPNITWMTGLILY